MSSRCEGWGGSRDICLCCAISDPWEQGLCTALPPPLCPDVLLMELKAFLPDLLCQGARVEFWGQDHHVILVLVLFPPMSVFPDVRASLSQNTVLWIYPIRKAEEVAVLSAPGSLSCCLQWWSQVPNKCRKGEYCKSQSGTAELEVGLEPSVSLISSAFN